MGPAEPEVSTTSGRVRGRVEHGNAVFRGIPFAQPPLWRPAVPGAGAAGPVGRRPRRGRVRPAVPAGGVPRATPEPGAEVPADTTGEWLTVNVWTPDTGGAHAPGHGLDSRRRVPVRRGRSRLRRHAVRERRRGLRLLQLPPGHGGLRPDRRRARQPRPARRRRGAALGQGQHRTVRRRPGQRHRLRRVGGRWRDLRAARAWTTRRACSSGPSRSRCQARSSAPELAGAVTEAIAATAGLPADYEALRRGRPDAPGRGPDGRHGADDASSLSGAPCGSPTPRSPRSSTARC